LPIIKRMQGLFILFILGLPIIIYFIFVSIPIGDSHLIMAPIIPVITYSDAGTLKLSAIKDNYRKSGIYRWVNLINAKSYVGGSINLGSRFRDYFKYSFLIHPKNSGPARQGRGGPRSKMTIYKAILKYGYSNFNLESLEYCDITTLIEREQYYIDTLNPEYNILNMAGSSSVYKHTEEGLTKLREHLIKLNKGKGIKVEVTDMETNTKIVGLGRPSSVQARRRHMIQ
jgi:hypothetical protein